MAHRSRSPAIFCALLTLALLSLAAAATAANPLGMAVAGAPSMFVLAVAEARGDSKEGRAVQQDREPPSDTALPVAERSRQAAAQPVLRERSDDRRLVDGRDIPLR
ncbi:MAG TPA: hypothetical protein VF774_04555 [Pseudoduganella sp.]